MKYAIIYIAISFILISGSLGCGKKHSSNLMLSLGQGVKMELALIPSGSFMMGRPTRLDERGADEGPEHYVTISKPFYMGIYEVTQEQYKAITGEDPSCFKGLKHPVEMVSWEDAMSFCEALSKKSGKVVRLPSEAQWEYACRAGTTTKYSFGDLDSDLHKYGNYGDKSFTDDFQWQHKNYDDGHGPTAPVGSYKPNPFGLYDMHGNLWEWCRDWRELDYYENSEICDPQGGDVGKLRMIRGGSFLNGPRTSRSVVRTQNLPDSRVRGLGFRVIVVK